MDHDFWMRKCLKKAQEGALLNEVPVGAAIVSSDHQLISLMHNMKESTNNPCGHAEVLCIKEASEKLNKWRLTDCRLYVTLEPCMMCTGAIIHSRLSHVIFGAFDPKTGFISSVAKGLNFKELNHTPEITSSVLENECSELLKSFFRKKRASRS